MTGRWLFAIVAASCVACVRPYPVIGLRPDYPKPLDPKAVDSLQPTLRWQRFPREADAKADVDGWLVRIRNVTYDLRVWRTVERPFPRPYPAELVYSRDGLAEPVHRVEVVLAPSTSYLWTVRARFELDGQTRVTEWSMLKGPGGRDGSTPPRAPFVPSTAYYEFRTPRK